MKAYINCISFLPYVYPFYPMYNVSTSVVIWIYWGIIVPRASGPLDIIPQYVRITTDVLYQYSAIFKSHFAICNIFIKSV
jgi:hypothetical protein